MDYHWHRPPRLRDGSVSEGIDRVLDRAKPFGTGPERRGGYAGLEHETGVANLPLLTMNDPSGSLTTGSRSLLADAIDLLARPR